MTEAQFQSRIIDYARLRGWRVAHFRPALTAKGWRTAVEGDAGFPDLVLARRGTVILAEVKADAGRLRPEQMAWQEACGAKVWRPVDWDQIAAELA